jgi:uncharacterized protein with HEPN domain
MILSMSRIEEYIKDYSIEEFKKDYKTVDAVIRNLEVIGEAANKIPEQIKEKYDNVPWDEMYLARNKISHEYFGIDYDIIWDIISNHLPGNRIQIQNIIDSEF